MSESVAKRVAFVLPFYNEEEVLPLFHQALIKATKTRPDFTYEFIYVNDGSKDSSPLKVLELREEDSRVTLLNFAKNYGHELAATAGLDFAHETSADAIVLMDTDLQDPPEVAMAMLERWEQGVDVVYGQRRTRNDTAFKKRSAAAFYWLLTKLSETEIPPNTSNFRVLDRRALSAVVQYREQDRFLRGIVSHVGFNQEPYLFDRPERAAGETHYTMRHMINLANTAIFGFSTWPLRAITHLGAAMALLSLLYGVIAIVQRFVVPELVLPGWTFIIVAMMFLGGVQMCMLGVIGNYVGRTYVETLKRPLYIMESIARTGEPEDERLQLKLEAELESEK